jgi:hypothetical protein
MADDKVSEDVKREYDRMLREAGLAGDEPNVLRENEETLLRDLKTNTVDEHVMWSKRAKNLFEATDNPWIESIPESKEFQAFVDRQLDQLKVDILKAKEQDFGASTTIGQLQHRAQERIKANLPESPVDEFLSLFQEAADKAGMPVDQRMFQGHIRRQIKQEISENQANYLVGLTPIFEAKLLDPEEADRATEVLGKILNAVAMQTAMRYLPEGQEDYTLAATMTGRTLIEAAEKEIGDPESFIHAEEAGIISQGGDEAKAIVERKQRALERLKAYPPDAWAGVRSHVARGLLNRVQHPTEKILADTFGPAQVPGRKILPPPGTGFPFGSQMIQKLPTERELMFEDVKEVLGPDAAGLFLQFTSTMAENIRFHRLGVISGGIDFEEGQLVADPNAAGLLSPLRLTGDNVATWIAEQRQVLGPVVNDMSRTRERIERTLKLKAKAAGLTEKEQADMRAAEIERLSGHFIQEEHQRAQEAISRLRAGLDPNADVRKALANLPFVPEVAEGPIMAFYEGLETLGRGVANSWDIARELASRTGGIPAIRQASQKLALDIVGDPTLAITAEDPADVLVLMSRNLMFGGTKGSDEFRKMGGVLNMLPVETRREFLDVYGKYEPGDWFGERVPTLLQQAQEEVTNEQLSGPHRAWGAFKATALSSMMMVHELFREVVNDPVAAPVILALDRGVARPAGSLLSRPVRNAYAVKAINRNLKALTKDNMHRMGLDMLSQKIRDIAVPDKDLGLVDKQLEFLAGSLDEIARSGGAAKGGIYKDAAATIKEIAPRMRDLDRPLAEMFAVMEDPRVLRTLRKPGVVRKMAQAVTRGVLPYRPQQTPPMIRHMLQLDAEYAAKFIDNIIEDPQVFGHWRKIGDEITAWHEAGRPAALAPLVKERVAEFRAITETALEKASRQVKQFDNTFDNVAAQAEAGAFRAGSKEFGKLKDPELRGQVERLVTDYRAVTEYYQKWYPMVHEALFEGAKARIRTDALIGSVEGMVRLRRDRAQAALGQADLELKVYGLTGEMRKVRLDDVVELQRKVNENSTLLTELGQYRKEMAAIPDLARRDIRPNSPIWKVIDRNSPDEFVHLMHYRSELFPDKVIESLVPGKLIDFGGKLVPKKVGEVMKLFEGRGMFHFAKEHRQRILDVMKQLEGASKRVKQAKTYGTITAFNQGHFPYHAQTRMAYEAKQAHALNQAAATEWASNVIEQLMKLPPEARKRFNSAMVLRDTKALNDMARVHPWIGRELARLHPEIGIEYTHTPSILGKNFLEIWDDQLQKAVEYGRIDQATYNHLKNRTITYFNDFGIDERPRLVSTESVRKSRAEVAQDVQAPEGFDQSVFEKMQRDIVEYRLLTWDRKGNSTDLKFETEDAALEYIREHWGKEFAEGIEKATKTQGQRTLKNAAGNEVTLADPIGEEYAKVFLDPVPLKEQGVVQVKKFMEMVQENWLAGALQTLEGKKGMVVSSKEFSRMLKAGTDSDKAILENNYVKLATQLRIPQRVLKSSLGKYADYYWHKNVAKEFVYSSRAHRRLQAFQREIEKFVQPKWVTFLQKGPKVLTPIAKTSQIMQNMGVWAANKVFNFWLHLHSSTPVTPGAFRDTVRWMGEFKQARAQGKIHWLEQEMIEELGMPVGWWETITNRPFRKAYLHATGLKNTRKLRAREGELAAILEKERIHGMKRNLSKRELARLKGDEASVKAAIEFEEMNWTRRYAREMLHIWTNSADEFGLPKSASGNWIREVYNNIDNLAKAHGYIHQRLTRGLSREGATWFVLTFLQDYGRVPLEVQALGNMPIFGSMVVSFPYELLRLTKNHWLYAPERSLFLASLLPTYNMMQWLKSGQSWDGFMQALENEGFGRNRASIFWTMMTKAIVTDETTGNVNSVFDLGNMFFPLSDMYRPTGAIGTIFNMFSDPTDRGAVATAFEPILGVLSKFALNTPITNAAASVVGNFRRAVVDPRKSSTTDYMEAFGRGMLEVFIPPWVPYFGRDGHMLWDAIYAPVDPATGQRRRTTDVGDVVSKMLANIRVKGDDPAGWNRALNKVTMKVLGLLEDAGMMEAPAALRDPQARFTPDVAAKRIVLSNMPQNRMSWFFPEYSREKTLQDIQGQLVAQRMMFEEHVEDPDAEYSEEFINKVGKRIRELEEERLLVLKEIPVHVEGDDIMHMTDEEIRRTIRSLENRGDIYEMMSTLPIRHATRAIIQLDQLDGNMRMPDETMGNLVDRVIITKNREDLRKTSDPGAVKQSLDALRLRILARGGKVFDNGVVDTESDALKRLWSYLWFQQGVSEIENVKKRLGETKEDAIRRATHPGPQRSFQRQSERPPTSQR